MTEEKTNLNGEVDVELVVSEHKPSAKPFYFQFLLPGAILVAALIVSGTLFITRGDNAGKALIGGSGAKQPAEKVDVKIGINDHVLGNQNAKVTIMEFSDFQCPFCRSFWSDSLPQLKKEYINTGKVKFVYKHFPLDFHSGAKPAAEASECAADQGKFWEMHDKIFEEQAKKGQGTIQFSKADIIKWSGAIGLNVKQLNDCLSSGKYAQKVADDAAHGARLGVSGTPTTFVDGQRMVGAQPYSTFKARIDATLK